MNNKNKKAPGTKNKPKPAQGTGGKSGTHESLGNDYWDRIADDVAAGYKNDQNDENMQRTDQEVDDPALNDPAS